MKLRKSDSIVPAQGNNEKAEKKSDGFPVVGIGASAGGIEALEQFFQNVPANPGFAFIVIQHLDPNRPGIMPELLQRMTSLKVLQATDRLKLKPDCVYVIPPNKSMSLLKNSLLLFDPVESHGLRLPIDVFFRSLADDKLEKSIGIILSGMGSDGSLGLKAIKERGGMVLVQDPASAKFDSMPRNAIESVIVDIVAPAEELPPKLISSLNLVHKVKTDAEIESKVNNIDKITALLRDHTGHDFSLYKKTTLFRRIERRKNVHQIDKIQNYVRFMQENPAEIEILFKELLIGVTNFFRDINVWEYLKDKVLPGMIEKLPDKYVLRAWVCGCSTGEEAYSLAIVFKEVMAKLKKSKSISLQIFATDLDSDAIDKARRGYYNKNITADVSPERINQFFTAEGDAYRIKTSIREMVVFAPQNVTKDPPFTKLDILTCRNMLIYMEHQLQQKLLSLFNYSLNPGGIMLLGSSESLGNRDGNFFEIDARLKIFKRSTKLSISELMDFPQNFRQNKKIKSEKSGPSAAVENIQSITDQIVIQRFSPPSVLVTSKGDIIYITGRTGKYLEPLAGKANWNIHAMAREGLRHELPGAFRKAMQNFDPVILHNVKVGTNGGTQFVDVTIQRIENPESIRGMIMVVFHDLSAQTHQDAFKTKNVKGNLQQKELEIELQRCYEEIQSMREEMQTSQEELKSTNEELQSTNEELQSNNEELTTSKEEMQSLNEELQTVNIELQSKVNDLLQVNDDMKNLLNSTEIATLFLDRDLNIRRFTDPLTNIFKIRSIDIGRPFTDLVTNLQYSEIDEHARKVIKTLTPIETAITTNHGKWFNIRIMPYRTTDDRIDGIVITFNDVTIAKKLEMELKEINKSILKKDGDTST